MTAPRSRELRPQRGPERGSRPWTLARPGWLCVALFSLVWLVSLLGAGAGRGEAAPADAPAVAPVRHGPMSRGTAVYPAQTIPLRFNHGLHLEKGMSCDLCHQEIAASQRVRDHNFPPGRSCDPCHGIQHGPALPPEAQKCEMCHTRVERGQVLAALRAPAAALNFNHKLHLDRGAACEQCHGDMGKVRLATTLQLPREADCLACHDGKAAPNSCATCHPVAAGGRLQTRRDDRPDTPALIPDRKSAWGAPHDLNFVQDHSSSAKANPALCDSCHHPDDCQTCHNGVLRPMRIHPADYINGHSVDARGQVNDCQSCHRYQTDCRACHQRLGLGAGTPEDRFGVGSTRGFHPAGWAGAPGAPQGHAAPAQRNLGACASCHDEDTCLACHATTAGANPGLGVSPHGPRFARSPRCTQLARANRRVCLRCHVPADPALSCIP